MPRAVVAKPQYGPCLSEDLITGLRCMLRAAEQHPQGHWWEDGDGLEMTWHGDGRSFQKKGEKCLHSGDTLDEVPDELEALDVELVFSD